MSVQYDPSWYEIAAFVRWSRDMTYAAPFGALSHVQTRVLIAGRTLIDDACTVVLRCANEAGKAYRRCATGKGALPRRVSARLRRDSGYAHNLSLAIRAPSTNEASFAH